MSTYVFGDTHGNFSDLNKVLKDASSDDIIIITGDFGYWKKSTFKLGDGWFHEDIQNPNGAKIYFCSGNHEDLQSLKILSNSFGWKEPIPIDYRIWFCPRGCELELPDSRKVLFIGGALSIDKHLRTPYVDWFPEELISYNEFMRLDPNKKYDIIVSHTCPDICVDRILFNFGFTGEKIKDPCTTVLQEVFDLYKPKEWFFGHWHGHDDFIMQDCHFHLLNMTGKLGHYTILQ